jgi:hypothetical protein
MQPSPPFTSCMIRECSSVDFPVPVAPMTCRCRRRCSRGMPTTAAAPRCAFSPKTYARSDRWSGAALVLLAVPETFPVRRAAEG